MSALHPVAGKTLGPLIRILLMGTAAWLLFLCASPASAEKAPDWWAADGISKAGAVSPSAGGSEYSDAEFFFPPLLPTQGTLAKRAVYEGDTQTIEFDLVNQYPYQRNDVSVFPCVYMYNRPVGITLPDSLTISSYTVCFLTISRRPETPMQPPGADGLYHHRLDWNGLVLPFPPYIYEYGDFTCPAIMKDADITSRILGDGYPVAGQDGRILRKVSTLPARHARQKFLFEFTVPTFAEMGVVGQTTATEVYVKVWIALPNYVPDQTIPQIYTEFYGCYVGWDYFYEGNFGHGCLGPAFTVYRKTPPSIIIDPSTITLVSDQRRDMPRLITSAMQARSASIAPAGAPKPPPNRRDQRPQFRTDEVIVQLRTAEAARLLAARIGANMPAMLATESMAPLGLSDLPPGCTGIKPYFSGDDKARRMAEAKLPAVGQIMARGAALSPQQTTLVAETLVSNTEPYDSMAMFYVKLEKGADPRAVCKALEKRPDVVFACLSPICYPFEASQTESSQLLPLPTVSPSVAPGIIPDDPLYNKQWNMDRMNMPAAWSVSRDDPRTDPEIRVCVVDSGVRLTHQDFRGRLIYPKDVYVVPVSEDPRIYGRDAYANDDPEDDDILGHGTACAGLVAAIRGNRLNVAGGAPVKIIPVNTDAGDMGFIHYEDGVRWGVDHGAKVISMSLGGTHPPTGAELAAGKYASAHDVLGFAAAGNADASADMDSPASIPDYITVGAVDAFNNRVRTPLWFWGSNTGQTVDIVAPGQGVPGIWDPAIYALWSGSDTQSVTFMNGTSAACPQVAGVCALLRSEYPELSANTVRLILLYTARDMVGLPVEDTPGWDPYYGWGLVDAEAAFWVARSLTPNYFTIYNRGTQPLTITKFEMVRVVPPPPPPPPEEPPEEPPGPPEEPVSAEAAGAIMIQNGARPLAVPPPEPPGPEEPKGPTIVPYPKPSWLLWAPEPPFVIAGMSQQKVLVDPGYIKRFTKPEGILRIQVYSDDPKYMDMKTGKVRPYPGARGQGAVNLVILNPTAAQRIPWSLLD
jgi:subtilisin family serine protease